MEPAVGTPLSRGLVVRMSCRRGVFAQVVGSVGGRGDGRERAGGGGRAVVVAPAAAVATAAAADAAATGDCPRRHGGEPPAGEPRAAAGARGTGAPAVAAAADGGWDGGGENVGWWRMYISQLATFSSDAGDVSDATRMMTWGGGDAS